MPFSITRPGPHARWQVKSSLFSVSAFTNTPNQFMSNLISLNPEQRWQKLRVSFYEAEISQKWQLIDALFHNGLYLTAYEVIESLGLDQDATTQLSPQQWLTIAQNLPQQAQAEVCQKYLTDKVINKLNPFDSKLAENLLKEIAITKLKSLTNTLQLSIANLRTEFYRVWQGIALNTCNILAKLIFINLSEKQVRELRKEINVLFKPLQLKGIQQHLMDYEKVICNCLDLYWQVFDYKYINKEEAEQDSLWRIIMGIIYELYENYAKLQKSKPTSTNSLVTAKNQALQQQISHVIIFALIHHPPITNVKMAKMSYYGLMLYKNFKFQNTAYPMIYDYWRWLAELYIEENDSNYPRVLPQHLRRKLIKGFKKIFSELIKCHKTPFNSKYYLINCLLKMVSLSQTEGNLINTLNYLKASVNIKLKKSERNLHAPNLNLINAIEQILNQSMPAASEV